jgi:16S rRNA (guanine527-N7)-methyltransferase
VTLIEATGKKVRFLQHVIPLLGLENALVVPGRAEDVARHPEQRERFDLAISRAVGSVASLIELLVPLIRVGGTAVLLKSRAQVSDELEVAGRALRELHSRIAQVSDVRMPIAVGDRVLVEVRKDAPSPERYPRRSGLPQRRPLVGP